MASLTRVLGAVTKVRKLQELRDRHQPQTSSRLSDSIIDFNRPVVDLVPCLSPNYEAPRHLAAYGDELDKAIERCRNSVGTFEGLCIAAPPQHSKTSTTEHALVKALVTLHGKSHAYATYAQATTLRVQNETRRICEAIGLEIQGTQSSWYIPATKSSVRWTSVGGPLTSDPVSGLLICDDPFKDYAQARSAIERDKRWEWLVQVALRRLHPGSTVLIMATRWLPDDLTGRAITRLKWKYLNIKAICDDPTKDPALRGLGEALWSTHRPLEFLRLQQSADPFSFRAQYQGDPQDLGTRLFEEPSRFTHLPDELVFRTGYGADLAYSAKTISDWSVLLRGRKIGDTLYILHCLREQLDATKFLSKMKAEVDRMKGPVRFYSGGGGELGVSSFIQREIPSFHQLPATQDKVTRSTKARQAWNLTKIAVPDEDSPYYGPWVEPFVNEITQFTGAGDRNDDQVDALAALYDELFSGAIDWSAADDLQSKLGGFRL